MKAIYICAPLAGNIKGNCKRVKNAIKKMVGEFNRVGMELPLFIVPHLLLYDITFNDKHEVDRRWGMECCLKLVEMVDEVIVIGDTITAGMAEEIAEAQRVGKTITVRRDL